MSKYIVEYLESVKQITGDETLEINDTRNPLYEAIEKKAYKGKEVMEAYVNCPILKEKSTYWSATIRCLKNEIIYDHYKSYLLSSGYKTFDEALIALSSLV